MDENNNKKKKRYSKKDKVQMTIAIIIACTLMISSFFVYHSMMMSSTAEVQYTEFMEFLEEDNVKEIEYDRSHESFIFKLKDNTKAEKKAEKYIAPNPRYDTFKQEMLELGVEVKEKSIGGNFGDTLRTMLMLFVQYGLMLFMFMFLMRKMQGGTDEMQIQTSSTKTFADVAGLDEVKESMMVIVDMLRNPKKYEAAGARIPNGCLLYGPPGTGKTLVAKAIAGEAGVQFMAVHGADFDNKYVGVGAEKVRKLFEQAKKLAPCILFIDEIDAVGTKRQASDKSFERQTLNQLLSCMDGFSVSDGVFVFAATNDLESLDPALLRPGRFDARYAIPLPSDTEDRLKIIKLYTKDKKLSEDVNLDVFAKQTLGCSPAAIEAILNEAAIQSVKNGGIINRENLDEAFYTQMMDGHRRKNAEREAQEIKTTAYHEAGHALVGFLQNQEVSKISIVPTTSGAGGVTFFNQKKLGMYSKTELEEHIRTLYAGRMAEEILNGKNNITTGASNDIEKATECIRGMVDLYGMSEYGLLNLNVLELKGDHDVVKVYQEISKRLASECLAMLKDHMDLLDKLAGALIERESLDEKEVIEILTGKKQEEESED